MSMQTKSVLIFAGPDFEDRELFYPLYRFEEEGSQVTVAGLGEDSYHGKYGVPIETDGRYEDYVNQAWDLVVIPGGWAPDKIRMNESALTIVRRTLERGAIVAAICHAGWVLASADVIKNRKVTSYKAIKDDLIHAGGLWVDEEVVVDTGKGTIVTSRTPADLPAFCRQLVALLAQTPAVV